MKARSRHVGACGYWATGHLSQFSTFFFILLSLSFTLSTAYFSYHFPFISHYCSPRRGEPNQGRSFGKSYRLRSTPKTSIHPVQVANSLSLSLSLSYIYIYIYVFVRIPELEHNSKPQPLRKLLWSRDDRSPVRPRAPSTFFSFFIFFRLFFLRFLHCLFALSFSLLPNTHAPSLCTFFILNLYTLVFFKSCCNTCEEVREAYRRRGWAMNNADGVIQVLQEWRCWNCFGNG